MEAIPSLYSIISNLPPWPRQEARELRRLLQAVYEGGMDKMREGEGRSEGGKIYLVKVALSLTEFGNRIAEESPPRAVLWPLTES